jgi:hypothetical protein
MSVLNEALVGAFGRPQRMGQWGYPTLCLDIINE